MRLDWRTAGAGGSRRGVPDDVVLVRVKALWPVTFGVTGSALRVWYPIDSNVLEEPIPAVVTACTEETADDSLALRIQIKLF